MVGQESVLNLILFKFLKKVFILVLALATAFDATSMKFTSRSRNTSAPFASRVLAGQLRIVCTWAKNIPVMECRPRWSSSVLFVTSAKKNLKVKLPWTSTWSVFIRAAILHTLAVNAIGSFRTKTNLNYTAASSTWRAARINATPVNVASSPQKRSKDTSKMSTIKSRKQNVQNVRAASSPNINWTRYNMSCIDLLKS